MDKWQGICILSLVGLAAIFFVGVIVDNIMINRYKALTAKYKAEFSKK